jgi:hypothetical protein
MHKLLMRLGHFTSPRVRGEVGAKRRVRGALRELLSLLNTLIEAPHPDALRASYARLVPVRTGRGRGLPVRRDGK